MAKVIPIEGCERCAPLIAELRGTISSLQKRVDQLEEQAGLNSTNSSKPPSSDPPSVEKPKKPPSGRRRGGQPGHPGKSRERVPAERVDHFVPVRPKQCERCQAGLEGSDPKPRSHQVVELPRVRAEVTEYQLHRLRCRGCGHTTAAALPAGVPSGAFGVGLQATIAVLSGAYRLSKRNIAQMLEDLHDVPISSGSVKRLETSTSEALKQPVEEAREHVREAPGSVHMDETGWREQNRRAWLWVALRGAVAVFSIRFSRGAKVAKEMLGEWVQGVLVSDRYSAYNWVGVWTRQLCWAHMLRDFKRAAEREGEAGTLGQALVDCTQQMFGQWKRVRDGTIKRSTFQTYYAVRFRKRIHALLEQGSVCEEKKFRGLCRWLLAREQAMWTFARYDDVEPTNNAAERALRHAVIWRKTSFGTQSRKGSEFVERMLTVATTLRLQDRNVLEYVTEACQAHLLGLPAPSLLQTHDDPKENLDLLAS